MNVGNKSLYFTYDASGQPMSVIYDTDTTDSTAGTTYYYITNIQGDVIGIVDASGNQVVSYSYDAWGNHLSTSGTMATTLGQLNPLRYRGYVYDQESLLYYLQSRYYNPKTGRFINADALVTTGQGLLGNNMFAYCLNNPAMYIDPDGYCMEVGALLTWIDCGNPECSTSSLSDPERYRGGYNNPKHIDSQRYYEEQAKTIETINIPIPEPVEVGIKGFAVGFCVGSLSGLAGAAFTAGMSPVMSGVAVGLLTGIEELIRYIIGNP